MKLINPHHITHIKMFDGFKGVENYLGNIIQVSYLPEKKQSWWKRNYPEGYYENGEYFNPNSYYNGLSYYSRLDRSRGYFVDEGVVHTLPHIEIFCGKDLIHKEIFQSQDKRDDHVFRNYHTCNILYQ